MSGVGFVAKTAALTRKDLRVEARSRDTLPPMLAFAFTVALVLAFSLPDATRASAKVVAGFLWITVLFAGLIGFARTFEVEREEGALDALLLVPLDRSGIFFSKAAANLVFLALVEVFLVPVFGLFFSLDLSSWLMLALVVVLVDIGFVAVGTLFASLASQTRSRELILPILALPVLVPAFIAGVELSADLFAGAGLDDIAARGWFGILLFFDAVFLVVGALGFEFAID
ncbi:MAG: heme exporter protein CcmB [Actinomycetota bacterium]